MTHTAPSMPAAVRPPQDAVPPPVAPHPMLGQPAFERLHRARRRFSWTLTATMLAVYFGFILTLAFRPAWLATPVAAGYPTTIGIPIGFGMFVLTFALVALYVHRTNTVYDRQIAALREGAAS
ncbi:DUF485 domain-containing protein [Cupriavidus plantarum]|uniref:DUF485 domain-containing protein n=1 Tax=Cupriavidus plantarum TaxID=942865 RepID=UPI000EB18C22|nr:DUF485 domain-containing protein [Cupriavidus plantarum]RLK39530.1 uncharacterized membrane protein (DUF485 family) [Cupriavidus plantarum]